MSMHVFTYGSLMFQRVWPKVVGGMYEKVDARLHGFKRRKIRDKNYPALLPGTNVDYVDGKIYLNVNNNDMDLLDKFEGEYYQRELAECELPDGDIITACAYVFKEKYIALIEDQEWDAGWFSDVGIFSFLKEYKGFC